MMINNQCLTRLHDNMQPKKVFVERVYAHRSLFKFKRRILKVKKQPCVKNV